MSSALLREKARLLLSEASPADLKSPQAIEAYLDRSSHSWTYGGNTSCVEVELDNQTFILDAGTGLRSLGLKMKEDGRDLSHQLHFFFTHFHWDHICGFPYFGPIYIPNRQIDVWSGRSDALRLLQTTSKCQGVAQTVQPHCAPQGQCQLQNDHQIVLDKPRGK
jgi:metal-dependent hydrolase (beta-lactamase superfamily II)